MPLNLFYTMVRKSQKWPKTQIKWGGPALTTVTALCSVFCFFTNLRNLVVYKIFSLQWHLSSCAGLSDIPGDKMVKLYCPKCQDVYTPKSSRHHRILLNCPEHVLNVLTDVGDLAFMGIRFGREE